MYMPLLEPHQRKQRLTKHFSYEEMTHTSCGVVNHPSDYELCNLLYLCRILESVRKKFGRPILVTSGYRNPECNNNHGGNKNSYHLDGRAVDIDTSSMSQLDVDRLESLLWQYNPIELVRYTTKPQIHVAY